MFSSRLRNIVIEDICFEFVMSLTKASVCRPKQKKKKRKKSVIFALNVSCLVRCDNSIVNGGGFYLALSHSLKSFRAGSVLHFCCLILLQLVYICFFITLLTSSGFYCEIFFKDFSVMSEFYL